MPQQQPQKSGEPPIGSCSVCGEPVTAQDPGKLEFTVESSEMRHVHDRCRAPDSPQPSGAAQQ